MKASRSRILVFVLLFVFILASSLPTVQKALGGSQAACLGEPALPAAGAERSSLRADSHADSHDDGHRLVNTHRNANPRITHHTSPGNGYRNTNPIGNAHLHTHPFSNTHRHANRHINTDMPSALANANLYHPRQRNRARPLPYTHPSSRQPAALSRR